MSTPKFVPNTVYVTYIASTPEKVCSSSYAVRPWAAAPGALAAIIAANAAALPRGQLVFDDFDLAGITARGEGQEPRVLGVSVVLLTLGFEHDA